MRIPIFIIGAIVLMVFAAIAASNATVQTLFGIFWLVWLCAGLASLFTHWWLGDVPVPTAGRRAEKAPAPSAE